MKVTPLKKILQYYLFVLAKIILWRTRPLVIAIAGTTNKSFTKLALEALLREQGQNTVLESYNTEIGLPLAILGLKSGYNSYKRWFTIIIQGFFRSFWLKLPKIIVLEFGSNQSGDLAYLAKIAKPKIAIITAITQRYLEQFGGIDKAALEYADLVKNISADGLVVLNADIPEVKKLNIFSKALVKYFSVTDNPAYARPGRASAGEINNLFLVSNFKTTEEGIRGVLDDGQNKQEFSLPYFGAHHAQAYAAAKAAMSFIKIL